MEQFEFAATMSNGQESGAGRPVIGPVMMVVGLGLERIRHGRRIRSAMSVVMQHAGKGQHVALPFRLIGREARRK